MFSSGPNYQKLKTNLRLSVNRLKLLEKKKTELAQKSRKEIADYISAGKVERAKIRVEHIIREDYLVEAMEVAEMYADLVLARFGLLQQMKDLDPSLGEAVSSLLWGAPRLMTDVPELKVVSEQLALKYGKAYAVACREQTVPTVSEKLVHKLGVQAPPKLLVEKYLAEIAAIYNLEYTPDPQVMREAEWAEAELIDLGGGGRPGGSGGATGGGGGQGEHGGACSFAPPMAPQLYPSKVNDDRLVLPTSLEKPQNDQSSTLKQNYPEPSSSQESFGSSDVSSQGQVGSQRSDQSEMRESENSEVEVFRPLPINQWAPSVLLTNPQSLTNCFEEFKSLVNSHSPDVVVVSETWFSDSKPACDYQLDGYKQFHDDRTDGRRGGGVAVYAKTHKKLGGLGWSERIRQSLAETNLNSPSDENVISDSKTSSNDAYGDLISLQPHAPDMKIPHELECVWVCVGEHTYVCGVYHAPNAPTETLLFDHITNASLDLINRAETAAAPVRIICAGDFNQMPTDRLNACLQLRNLVQLPTHGNSTLDRVLTNTPRHYQAPLLLPPLALSRHHAVLLTPAL